MSDYTAATWIGSPNYTPGRQQGVRYITLHIMAGYLAGTDTTFQTQGGASSTYGVGGNGSVHQYVRESDTPWSDGNGSYGNSAAISIEHEGGIQGAVNTDACVAASARLCADIARRQGWTKLVHGQNVRLHRELPPYTHPACPDRCPNPLRWEEIISQANDILEGDDMPSAQEIAEAVWNFEQNGTKCRDRLQGIDHAANDLNNNIGLKVWGFQIAKVQARDRLQGVDSIQLPKLQAQVAALSTAVKTLAESQGVDPDKIAQAVEEAVKAKLEKLKITVD